MIYRGRSVFDFRPDMSEQPAHGQLDDHVYDAPGAAVPWKPTSLPRRTLGLRFPLDGMEAIKLMRSFLSACDGRRLGFWIPVWFTDYVPTVDVAQGQTAIVVSRIGLASKLALSAQFRHLAIITADKLECYRIDSMVTGSTTETLTLDSALLTALDASRSVVCGLMFVRFADDDQELNHTHTSYATIDLKFVELPTEAEGTAHQGSRPLYLYRLTRGATVWYWTNWPVSVVAGGQTWGPADIEHNEIINDTEFANDPLSLTVTTDDSTHPLRGVLDPTRMETIEIDIFETDADTLTVNLVEPIHAGQIGEVRFGENGQIEARVSSLARIGEREAPRLKLQRTCHHRLFDAGCALVEASFITTGAIDVIGTSSPYIEATEFGAKATLEGDPNWFALGKVTVGTEARMCVGQSGVRLYLNQAFRAAIVGNTASARPGCDKRIGGGCTKLDNIANFMGFPYLPNRNPQFEALQTPKPGGGKKGAS